MSLYNSPLIVNFIISFILMFCPITYHWKKSEKNVWRRTIFLYQPLNNYTIHVYNNIYEL